MSARAPSGIRCATKRGAVWGLLRHGAGRCPKLVTLRNEVLEARRRTLATAQRQALAERWEVRRVEGVGECWGGAAGDRY